MLEALMRDPSIDQQYEKLFLARIYEGMAACAEGLDKPGQRDVWLRKLYEVYPQLIPFSGMKMPMRLQVAGTPDEAVIARLKDCNIRFDAGGAPEIRAQLSFRTQGKLKLVEYSVIDGA
jgi:hypothetical protein